MHSVRSREIASVDATQELDDFYGTLCLPLISWLEKALVLTYPDERRPFRRGKKTAEACLIASLLQPGVVCLFPPARSERDAARSKGAAQQPGALEGTRSLGRDEKHRIDCCLSVVYN